MGVGVPGQPARHGPAAGPRPGAAAGVAGSRARPLRRAGRPAVGGRRAPRRLRPEGSPLRGLAPAVRRRGGGRSVLRRALRPPPAHPGLPADPAGAAAGPRLHPALVLILVSAFGMMGSALFTTQYLQSVLGRSPLQAALWSLLPPVLIGVAAPVTGQLVARGANRGHVVAAGFDVSAAGYALLARAGAGSLWLVLTGAGVLTCGAVTVMSQLTDLAMGTAPVARAGTASSLLEAGTEFGGALGMAASAPSAPGSTGTRCRPRRRPGPARPSAARSRSPAGCRGVRERPWRRPRGRPSPAGCAERRSRGRWCWSWRRSRRP
ncbi:MFS transporter [Streptomyces sp. TG1A-8]|uniref:MFS transporter n=1 Tax=Streptomyces sp. TG1A-8 TaxID=3051385 RepID=UPI003463ABB4